MIRITQTLTVSALALTLAACNSSSERVEVTPNPPAGSAELRVHHTSANAPAVNVLANGEILAGLEGVDYQMSSPLLEVDAGTYAVSVEGILPGDEFETVIDEELSLEEGMRYDVFALGTLGAESPFDFGPFILANEVSAVPDGEARLQVLHGAPVDVPVDVYLTAPGAEIVDGAADFTLSYKEDAGPIDVAGGEYQVTLTVAGDASTVLFSSPTLDLAAGDDLMVVATLNVAANADEAPIALLVSNAEAANVVYSTTTGADVRVVHAAADAPAVDVHANEITASPAISELAFGEFTGYLNLEAADYNFIVTAAGATDQVVAQELSLMNGWQGSVFAAGELGDDTLNLQAIEFDNRRVATEARVRLVHASPIAGDVDIYVTPTADFSDSEPAFAGVPFVVEELLTTGNVALAAGTYFVTITPANTTDAAIGPLQIDVEGGGLYTAVAVGNSAETLGAILLDDLAGE